MDTLSNRKKVWFWKYWGDMIIFSSIYYYASCTILNSLKAIAVIIRQWLAGPAQRPLTNENVLKESDFSVLAALNQYKSCCLKFQFSVSPTIVVIIAIVNATTNMTRVTSKGIVSYDKLRTLAWLANLFKQTVIQYRNS